MFVPARAGTGTTIANANMIVPKDVFFISFAPSWVFIRKTALSRVFIRLRPLQVLNIN